MGRRDRECILLTSDRALDYREVLYLQLYIVDQKINKVLEQDVLMVLEHTPVFTIGKNGNRNNLLINDNLLKQKKISIFHINRGGDITYHGPGQIVVYPIFNIKNPRIGIKDFVFLLEQAMIDTANEYGILLSRNELNRGVWYNREKIGSIGIAIKRGIVYHGLALNIKLDLTPFSWINPCGLKNIQVGSISQILNRDISISNTKNILIEKFIDLFSLDIVKTRKFL